MVVAVVGALIGLFAFGLLRGRPDRDIRSSLIGKPVAGFDLPLYERYQSDYGPTFDLTEHQGKPQIINFWASWCVPCYEEAPLLEQFYAAHRDDIMMVGIQAQDAGKREEGRQFLDDFNLSFPNVYDDKSEAFIDYGVFGVPETFFVHADGTLAHKHAGPVTAELLETQLAELLP